MKKTEKNKRIVKIKNPSENKYINKISRRIETVITEKLGGKVNMVQKHWKYQNGRGEEGEKVNLYGWIATTVKDLTGLDAHDGCHGLRLE